MKLSIILAVSVINFLTLPAHSDGKKEALITLDVTGLPQAVSTLSQICQKSISVEVESDTATVLGNVTLQVRKCSSTNTISELTSLFAGYTFAEDSATGVINIYPRVGSRLDWTISNMVATNLSIAEVFADDVFGFGKHGIIFFPGRGNLAWLDHKIHITKTDGMDARHFLNKLCRELPFKARWELHSPRTGSDAILMFCGFGN